ncbi:MAG: FAD-binding protein [Thermaerobacter sp.]|nr:FAD-binding protein [Thermaerobacter sp.]
MSASSTERDASQALKSELQRCFGARCRVDAAGLRLYGYDAMGTEFAVPSAVVQVESTEEAAALIEIVRSHGGKLVARGSGTGLSGGSVPKGGAVVVSFERMRATWDLQADERTLRVQPGVVNGSLERLTAPYGLFYPPDPASYRVSSIGGNVAENAGGPHAVKYGVTGQHVRALEVVAADGCSGWLHAGAVQPGSDLVALLTGSEGTLGLVTAVQLQLERRPQEIATLLLSFLGMEGATDYVSAAVAAGLLPATLEFMDRPTIEAVEAWGAARYPEGAGAILLMELDGTAEEVAEGLRLAKELGERGGALAVETAQDPAAREALWYGRRGSYAAVARHGRRLLTQDVTVPRALLTEMLQEVSRIAARYGLQVATVGHAGDGNLHPDFPYDPDDPEESGRVHAANAEVIAACVRLGGSITGEHGIGMEKIHQMHVMYSPAELGLMAAVRRALDPEGLLNPGKAVPLVPRHEAAQRGQEYAAPKSPKELQEAVLWARASGRPLRVSLSGLRGIAVDSANLTAEVGAGESLEALSEALAQSPLAFVPCPLRAATLGEALLQNDYGPEHLGAGTLRAHLLAITYVTGAGELVRIGRSVMKNVAGYDLFRLLIGSRGRLGIPAQVTLRLLPRRAVPWWTAKGEMEALCAQAAGARSLFALPSHEGVSAFAQASAAPGPGWAPAPQAIKTLTALKEELRRGEHLLDLALPQVALAGALSALPTDPLIVLPGAARLLARLPQAEAREIVEAIAREHPLRADYGLQREPLAAVQGVAADWEERLRNVFDPDGILARYTTWEEAAR